MPQEEIAKRKVFLGRRLQANLAEERKTRKGCKSCETRLRSVADRFQETVELHEY